jgi:hypothetical protein
MDALFFIGMLFSHTICLHFVMGIVLIAQGIYFPYSKKILRTKELVETLNRPSGLEKCVFYAYALHSRQDWLRGETLVGRLK